jgi:hypothetical protein
LSPESPVSESSPLPPVTFSMLVKDAIPGTIDAPRSTVRLPTVPV